jgi:hypothetical protein
MVTTSLSASVPLSWLILSSIPTVFSAKLYLAGDSTMAKGNGKIEGYLSNYGAWN